MCVKFKCMGVEDVSPFKRGCVGTDGIFYHLEIHIMIIRISNIRKHTHCMQSPSRWTMCVVYLPYDISSNLIACTFDTMDVNNTQIIHTQ